jgi:mannosyltransferase
VLTTDPAPPSMAPATGAAHDGDDVRRRSLTWVAAPGMVLGLSTGLWQLARQPLWLDEAYSLGATSQLGLTLRETSGTMGLYYALLQTWLRLSESVWWMRSLSVVLAVAAIAVAARLATRLVPDGTARLAAVLTPLSMLWLVYAREARSYALVMVLSAGAWLAFDHGLADADDRRRRRWLLAHTALATALPLAHGLALLQVIPQLALLLVARADRGTWVRVGRGLALGGVITAGLVAVGGNDVGNWVGPLSADQVSTVVQLFTSPRVVFAAPILVLLGIGIATRTRTAQAASSGVEQARALLPVAWALGPILLLIGLSVVRPSLVPRYVTASALPVALLLALGTDAVGRTRPTLRLPVAGAVVAMLALGHVDIHRQPTSAVVPVVEDVAADVRPGDTVLFAGDETRPSFEALWRDVDPAATPEPAPGARPLGRVQRFEAVDPSDPERWAEARGADRIWLVGDVGRDDLDGAVAALTGGGDPSHRIVERREPAGSALAVVLLEPTP